MPHSEPTPGDIYWLKQGEGISHPCVIVSIDNEIITVCQLTTNMNKATLPGNVVLAAGEAGLEKQSIVEVSKVEQVTSSTLRDYIGTLSSQRVTEILAGIQFLHKSYFTK
ncbi:MAG: type II toxin-antitoxin system PemK/MazF family toxin [Candidatus Doudnabacteria bacterium]|nr:type II toxin-antitoxin system PemK/MazF family toxin [Candidatus Doudnabacteria bacterium]